MFYVLFSFFKRHLKSNYLFNFINYVKLKLKDIYIFTHPFIEIKTITLVFAFVKLFCFCYSV